MMKKKEKIYTTVEISGVIVRIAKRTNTDGYTVGVIESMLPSEEEMEEWTKSKIAEWTLDNNKRMIALCDFLNGRESKN